MNPRLARRPLDPKRQVPQPFAQLLREDGTADFAALDSERTAQCVREGLCGLCGEALTYWIAFIGGEDAVDRRTFIDPPMHVECAEDAFLLCPHIRRPLVARRETDTEVTTPVGFSEGKPSRWGLAITRGFQLQWRRAQGGGVAPVLKSDAFKKVRWFEYEGSEIKEVSA